MKVDKQNERLFHFVDGNDRYCFDVFSGWANEEVPEHLENIALSLKNTNIDKGRKANGYFVPNLREVRAQYNSFHKSYKLRFTLFGDKTPITFGSSTDLDEANEMLKILVIRRDEMYMSLYVRKGHVDQRFRQYVKTGDIDILNELKKEYTFKQGLIKGDKKPKQVYFEQINNSRRPKLNVRDNGYFYSIFGLFGAKVPCSFYYFLKNRSKAEIEHEKVVNNRDRLYLELRGLVKRGDNNPKFKQYVKTGDIDILNELKQEYGKV